MNPRKEFLLIILWENLTCEYSTCRLIELFSLQSFLVAGLIELFSLQSFLVAGLIVLFSLQSFLVAGQEAQVQGRNLFSGHGLKQTWSLYPFIIYTSVRFPLLEFFFQGTEAVASSMNAAHSTDLLDRINMCKTDPKSSVASNCVCSTLINRGNFPPGFIFGAASSAYQFEGAFDENGKGASMWDNFTHEHPDKILDHSNGDVAVDSYHRYKEDVKIARDLGLNAYRISISWPRILPGGKIDEGVNQDGINYYNCLINELLANGIEPFVTLVHLDVPQALQDAYGGFLSSQIVADFLGYADLLFDLYGDRVKYWITTNEPWTLSAYGYAYGMFAPGRCSDWQGLHCTGGDSATEPYFVSHNQLLAHSAAVNLYRKKYQAWQEGKIGITLSSYWFEPYDETEENRKAKDRALDFMLGWFMEPLTRGDYPESMRSRVRGGRLPVFTPKERQMVKGSFDFIGLNYYGGIYAYNKPNSSSFSYATDAEIDITASRRNGKPIGRQGRNASRIYIYPKGLRQLLVHMKKEYDNPVIYITENGLDEAADDSMEVSEAIKDEMRKDYIRDHLCCLLEAIENVKGYFVWSLMDNFEWSAGFSVRFGLNYVDFKADLSRYPKHSALWFHNFLNTTTTTTKALSDQ
ncbi:beta-glucosidase 13-like [Andrographis paniculata]|uniref:beta-glucosidase 13-like n=1 Tax=Andrographis paniculata TaxID=175694 RepID=UPI0021E97D39|nr:beta-glucosidase 13-like [Andrographis paniculata]